MKKIFSMILIIMMLLTMSTALAEGMGVQVIGGPEMETEPVSLDDLKLETEAEIEGWGSLIATAFYYQDGLGHYPVGKNDDVGYYRESYYWSGEEAEYAILAIDILNTAMTAQNFLENCEVKAVYDDSYEFAGWYYQRNYDNGTDGWGPLDVDLNKQNTNWAIDTADEFAIAPMYKGHYFFGCTLPNSVVESKESLKLIITIDGNEITYNIRK